MPSAGDNGRGQAFPTLKGRYGRDFNDGTPAVKRETEGCVLRIGEEVAMTFDFPGAFAAASGEKTRRWTALYREDTSSPLTCLLAGRHT